MDGGLPGALESRFALCLRFPLSGRICRARRAHPRFALRHGYASAREHTPEHGISRPEFRKPVKYAGWPWPHYAGMRDNSHMPRARSPDPAARPAPVLIGEMLRQGIERLRAASDSPRLDCELLLAHALGLPRASLYSRSATALEQHHADRINALIEERAAGRPMAQIIGRKEFFSLPFEITADVLTPRPETELLVEMVANGLEGMARKPACLDLGTGCGAVAIALARLLPTARIVASDISTAALQVAKRNAARLAPGRIRFVRGSWYGTAGNARRFDAIAANPPYVESRLCGRGALRFEPRRALDGGADGLRDLRAVVSGAPRHLAPDGLLAVEHGARQAAAVRKMMSDAGLKQPLSYRDLAARERVSVAWRHRG